MSRLPLPGHRDCIYPLDGSHLLQGALSPTHLRANQSESESGSQKTKKEKSDNMTKSLLLIGTLALAGIASAKSYDITLAAPAKAGGVQMAAGNYEVKVVGNGFAVFTNVETARSSSPW